MAEYPSKVVSFTAHADYTDTIFASHPNLIQAEVEAIESTIGVNPKTSTSPSSSDTWAPGTTFATINARLANIEKGLVGDSHTQYLKFTGGTLTGNLAFSGGAKITGLPTPSDSSDAATKSFVETYVGNVFIIEPFLLMGV
jgi:hypothetical protein